MNDAQYQTATEHAQAGRWAEAMQSLENLARDHPNDQRVHNALSDVRFRAKLDEATTVGSRRWVVHWRPLVSRLLIVLAIGALAWQGAQIIERRVLPTQAQARAERQQDQLLEDARAAMEAGDLFGAEWRFRKLLDAEPDHPEGLRALAEITETRALEGLYADAVALQDERDYEGALAKLTELADRSPGFRDVDARIAVVSRAYELDDPFAEAEADFEAGRVQDAIAKYEQIRAINASYRRDAIVGRLAELYVQLGRTIVEAPPAASGPEAVNEGAAYFQTALDLQPRSDEAVWELRRAKAYLQGHDQYHEGQWDQAISQLRAVYSERSNYLGGALVELLYEALLRSGDRLLGAGDLFLAYERYREASRLPVSDPDDIGGRMDALQAIFTPTPTPDVTATPESTPTPEPKATTRATVAPGTSPGFAQTVGMTPTPTPVLPGGTLTVVYPYYYIIDREVVFDTEEWTGHLGVFFTGGLPPYEFALENGVRQAESSLPLRWVICSPAPLTIHIWSSDGQEAHQSIWVEPWCP
jgi:tetratricopeptide (TPR) repeat protein